MDIRQYDLWIDGLPLPQDFIDDFETQLEVSTVLTFNDGRVTNYDSGDSVIAANGAGERMPFARLRNTAMDFVLRNGDGPRPAVTIFSLSRDLRWESGPRNGIRPAQFREGVAQPLEWGRVYMFYQNFGRADQRSMSLRVVRCRQPLAPLHGNVPRRALRDRFEVQDTADNAENVY